MKIIVTTAELTALDTDDIVEVLEYVEADIERAQESGYDIPPRYTFDACVVEVVNDE